MTKTLQAKFDGEVFRPEPEEEIPLLPETRVQITIELKEPERAAEPYSFLDVALSCSLEGPPDWAENFDSYLYGGREFPE